MAKKKRDPSAERGEDGGTSSEVKRRKKEAAIEKEIEERRKKRLEKENEEKEKETTVGEEPEDETKEPKRAPKILTTREIGQHYMDRDSFLKLSLREMLIYFVFLIILGILARGQHDINEYYLSRVMIKLFVETKFKTWGTHEIINYLNINTLEQIWEYFNFYLEHTYWEHWYLLGITDNETRKTTPEEQAIFYNNKIIGKPRLRQLRVREDSCTVPDDFRLMFSHCYAEYTSKTECTAPFGYDNSTAWQYSSASTLKSQSMSGEISTYHGGGFYLDFTEDMDATNGTIRDELFNGLWLDRASRAVILQFTSYNVHANIFFTLTLLMELPPTGGVLPTYIIHTHKFIMGGLWDMVLLVCTGIFIFFIFLFTIEEIFEISYFKWHYFDSFWNFIDFVILILSYITIGFFIYSWLAVQSDLSDLIKTENEHACFDRINNAREYYTTFLAIVFFFAAIKLLKYMSFNHSMHQMQTTLSRAAKDIACFSIIFFIVFITFAQLGHLLFGSQVKDFRSFVDSMFALLRTSVGDFDYHKIENVNHFLGPLFFFSYIFFIYFILANMFLAIIIDTYSEVRASIRGHARDLHMSDLLQRWLGRFFPCCKPKEEGGPSGAAPTAAQDDVQRLLKRCGFTDKEIDLFFTKFDIPKDRPISQDEMRAKLMSNMTMQANAEKRRSPEEGPERDEVGELMMARIRVLEDNITDVNYKIDLIDNKIDAIQQIRARRRTQAADAK